MVKYFRVPSVSERTNRLLRNCPLSRPLFINMPSLIPAGSQQGQSWIWICYNTEAVCVIIHLCTHFLHKWSFQAQRTPSFGTLLVSTAPSTPWAHRWSVNRTRLQSLCLCNKSTLIVLCILWTVNTTPKKKTNSDTRETHKTVLFNIPTLCELHA